MHVIKGMVGCLGEMEMFVKADKKALHVILTV